MRHRNPFLVTVLATCLAPVAQAACEYPAAVTIPDGQSATQEEITTTSATVKAYLANMDTYLACIDAEAAAVPVEQQTPESKAMHVKRYNAAVDAMELTANSFNEQLRAFKAVKK